MGSLPAADRGRRGRHERDPLAALSRLLPRLHRSEGSDSGRAGGLEGRPWQGRRCSVEHSVPGRVMDEIHKLREQVALALAKLWPWTVTPEGRAELTRMAAALRSILDG